MQENCEKMGEKVDFGGEFCQKRSKMIQKKLFSLRAITRSSRRTKEMSAHGCARRDAKEETEKSRRRDLEMRRSQRRKSL